MNIYLDGLLLLYFGVGCEDKLFIILFTKNSNLSKAMRYWEGNHVGQTCLISRWNFNLQS